MDYVSKEAAKSMGIIETYPAWDPACAMYDIRASQKRVSVDLSLGGDV